MSPSGWQSADCLSSWHGTPHVGSSGSKPSQVDRQWRKNEINIAGEAGAAIKFGAF